MQRNYAKLTMQPLLSMIIGSLQSNFDATGSILAKKIYDEADVGALKKRGIKLGLSTHDQNELDRALTFDPEYIALGPVYPTILKKMKWHEQGLPRVTEWKKYIRGIPLVAIGGMTVERTAEVFEAGADIISVVTDITLNKSPEARVKSWIDATR